jgi:hypothetical protein
LPWHRLSYFDLIVVEGHSGIIDFNVDHSANHHIVVAGQSPLMNLHQTALPAVGLPTNSLVATGLIWIAHVTKLLIPQAVEKVKQFILDDVMDVGIPVQAAHGAQQPVHPGNCWPLLSSGQQTLRSL